MVRLAFNCYVIETGGATILVETGGGNKLDGRALERMRMAPPVPLPELISRAGIDPERIDMVLNSHLHWDHCGWNTVLREGKAEAAFPRARYFARRGEWEHAHTRHPRDSVSYLDQNYDPLVESGRMILFEEPEREIVPGVRMKLAPGHNRDMLVVAAESGGKTFAFFSDLVPTAAHATPTWVAAFDLFPLESIAQKRVWLGRAAREEWICGLGHDADSAFVRFEAGDGEGLKFTAVSLPESA